MKSLYKKKLSITHRALHWSLGLMMLILFITGFLRMEWMNKKNTINIINLHTANQINPADTKLIAKEILAPMWQWHVIAAYGITLLLIARIVYMLAKGIQFPNPFNHHLTGKERLQGSIYILFYLFLCSAIITGFYLNLGGTAWKAPMESVHKLAIYWFPLFFFLHLIGILISECTNKKGIVSKMISG